LYSNLRFVISASLVGCAGLIGVLALLPPTLEERLLASAELSAPPAPACNQQNWLHFDRNCLSRRGMPWVADLPAQKEAPSPIESAPEPPLAENQFSAPTQSFAPQAEELAKPLDVTESRQTPVDVTASRQEPVSASRQEPVTASRQEPPPSPIAAEPQVATQPSEAPQQEASAPPVAGERPVVKQRNVTRHAAPPPVAAERRVAKPVVEPQPPAAKKTTREARGAKPSNEALSAVRRFQDNLRDIPVSSYAADGTQRTIVIRPTSIQDVYYYSAPR
jgi:hypothetical protein